MINTHGERDPSHGPWMEYIIVFIVFFGFSMTFFVQSSRVNLSYSEIDRERATVSRSRR